MTIDITSSLTTLEVVADAIDVLRDGDVVLGGALIDYAAADMLNVFAELHAEAALDLNVGLPEIREFARLVVKGWPL
jgi:hypothetical protein